MERKELKKWAKDKIKGNVWKILAASLITEIIANFSIGGGVKVVDGQLQQVGVSIPVGLFLYFVVVGFASYMGKFINNKECQIKDLFNYSSDFVRCFLTNLLQGIFVVLWSILLIVPGIMKALAYSLVPILLADDKYKDSDAMQILKKSEEIMNGHKMDLFVLYLSFIGWHLLAILTCGILELWIIPYMNTTVYKFLYDIKDEYEKKSK